MNFDKNKYKKRIVDLKLDFLFDGCCAIYIRGCKWCGKTWCGKFHSKTGYEILDSTNNYSLKKMIDLEPNTVTKGEIPILIDEGQEIPKIGDTIRYAVDNSDSDSCHYILTGSTTPNEKLKIHSGAGRIIELLMKPMTYYEIFSTGYISLKEMFNKNYNFQIKQSTLKIDYLAEIIVKGGGPSNIDKSEKIAISKVRTYLNQVIYSDISRIDNVARDTEKIFNLFCSLSRTLCRLPKIQTIISDIAINSGVNISSETINNYLLCLKKLFVIEEIKPGCFQNTSKIRMRETPKIIFSDPSIPCSILRYNSSSLLKDLNFFGLVFESFVLRDLTVFCDLNDFEIFHYRDQNNLEVDCIIKDTEGRFAAIEIKLGSNEVEEAKIHLNKFCQIAKENGSVDIACKIIIVGVNCVSEKTEDGFFIVPFEYLKF